MIFEVGKTKRKPILFKTTITNAQQGLPALAGLKKMHIFCAPCGLFQFFDRKVLASPQTQLAPFVRRQQAKIAFTPQKNNLLEKIWFNSCFLNKKHLSLSKIQNYGRL
jgi:hypothetical protein